MIPVTEQLLAAVLLENTQAMSAEVACVSKHLPTWDCSMYHACHCGDRRSLVSATFQLAPCTLLRIVSDGLRLINVSTILARCRCQCSPAFAEKWTSSR